MSMAHILQPHIVFIIFAGLVGCAIGSFLNVVIHRLPQIMQRDWQRQCRELLNIDADQQHIQSPISLLSPGSHCPACQHKITAMENIPIISYLLLKGHCKACGAKISIQYPLVEGFAGLSSAYLAWHFGFSLQALCAMPLIWALICLSLIDLQHTLLPDDITLPVMWLGIACNIFGIFTDLHASVIGAMLGYGVLWMIFTIFKAVTGKEGIGYGDFKLLALLGAWLGWQALPLIVILSSVAASILGIIMIAFGDRTKETPFPFGPYLAVSGWIVLLWGHDLTDVYLHGF